MNRLRAVAHDDDGFTILELIIAMLIMGVVLAPLATAFFITVGTTKTTSQTVKDSSDAQLLSSFFADDVASADTVSRATSCGGANTVVQLQWIDGAITRQVAYVTVEDTATETELHVAPVYRLNRVTCDAPGATTTNPVARSLSVLPVLRCDAATCPVGAAKPRSVSLQLDEYGAQSEGQAPDAHYVFTVQGTRRVNS